MEDHHGKISVTAKYRIVFIFTFEKDMFFKCTICFIDVMGAFLEEI